MWLECLDGLGLEGIGLQVAGLRAGKATQLFFGGTDMARLRMLGRWRSLHTLEHYVQEATAAAACADIPSHAQTMIQKCLKHTNLYSQPPETHWATYFSRDRQSRAAVQWQVRHVLEEKSLQ